MSELLDAQKKEIDLGTGFGMFGASDASAASDASDGGGCDGGEHCCPRPTRVIEVTYPRITIAEQAQIARIPGLGQRVATCETKIGTLEASASADKEEREAAHETMTEGIAANAAAIVAEKTRAQGAEDSLKTALGQKADKYALEELKLKVESENANHNAVETSIAARIDAVETAVATEKANRESADKAIQSGIDTSVGTVYSTLRGEAASQKAVLEGEIADAKTDVTTKVTTEETQRKAEDASLLQKITDETTARTSKDSELSTLISTKETSLKSGYQTADAALQTQITTNANTISANRTLFDNAKTALETADATLTTNLASEVTNRTNGDTMTLRTAKDYAKSLLSSALRYQGQVATLSDLESKSATAIKGDMWNVLNDGEGLASNFAFNGTGWDRLTESIDLSPYATIAYVDGKVTELNDKDAELEGKIQANTTKINTVVAAEKSRAQTAETTLQSNIDTEELAREKKDNELTALLNTLSVNVTTETKRIEALIDSKASTTESNAISRENSIKAELQKTDEALQTSVKGISETVSVNKTEIENSLAQEVTDRTNAVTELKNELTVTGIDGSSRLVGMGEVLSKIGQKQDKLQSGDNIKTINNQSVLGSGNLQVTAKTAFVMNMSVNSKTGKKEFDVTANEVKSAIDNDEDIIVKEELGGTTLTYRKSQVGFCPQACTVTAFCEYDGVVREVFFGIEHIAELWEYASDISIEQYDLETFRSLTTSVGEKVAKSGDTMSGDLTMDASKAVVFAKGASDGYTTSLTKTGVKHTAEEGDGSYTVEWPSKGGKLAVSSEITDAVSGKADKATTLSGYGITDAASTTDLTSLETKVSNVFSEGKFGDNAVAGEGINVGGKRVVAYKVNVSTKEANGLYTFVGFYYIRKIEEGAYFAASLEELKNHKMSGKVTSVPKISYLPSNGVMNDGREVSISKVEKDGFVIYEENVISFTEMRRIEGLEWEAEQYNEKIAELTATIEALTTRIAKIEALFTADDKLLIKNADSSKTYALGIEGSGAGSEDTLVITEQTATSDESDAT